MLIERTTLLEFDEAAEALRLRESFSGEALETMLALLQSFSLGRFVDAAAKFQQLPAKLSACVHPLMGEVLVDVVAQCHRQAHPERVAAQETVLSRGKRRGLALRGHVFGPAGLAYPRFKVR